MGFGKKSKGDEEAKAVVPVPASLPTERKQARMIINPEAVARMKDAEGQKEELKTKRTSEEVKRIIIVTVSTIVAIILFLIGMNLSEPIMLGSIKINTMTFVMLAIMTFSGPVSFYESARLNRIEALESRLSDFLRDLAESGRAGLTLHQAIIIASRGDYGALSPEIEKMSKQISWGVSATDALTLFSQRVSTPLVNRAVTLINEATMAGGDVGKVLEAAANDTKEIQLLQQERKIQMTMYVAVIFVSFVVFLVVILIVWATFVPQMKEMADDFREAAQAGGDSGGGGGMGGFDPSSVDFDEIEFLYIAAALVQGVGDGLVAGLMGSGRIMDGLKYSFIMVMIVFVIFTFIF